MLSLHGSIAEKRFTAMDTLQGALISVFPLAGFGYLKKLRHLFSGFPDAGSVLRKTPVVDKRKVVSSFWVKWERIGECSVDVGLRLKQNPALWTGFWKFQAPLVCGPGFSGFLTVGHLIFTVAFMVWDLIKSAVLYFNTGFWQVLIPSDRG